MLLWNRNPHLVSYSVNLNDHGAITVSDNVNYIIDVKELYILRLNSSDIVNIPISQNIS